MCTKGNPAFYLLIVQKPLQLHRSDNIWVAIIYGRNNISFFNHLNSIRFSPINFFFIFDLINLLSLPISSYEVSSSVRQASLGLVYFSHRAWTLLEKSSHCHWLHIQDQLLTSNWSDLIWPEFEIWYSAEVPWEFWMVTLLVILVNFFYWQKRYFFHTSTTQWCMQRFFGDTITQQQLWGQKPPETQNNIIVIFEGLFSVFNMYGCHG